MMAMVISPAGFGRVFDLRRQPFHDFVERSALALAGAGGDLDDAEANDNLERAVARR